MGKRAGFWIRAVATGIDAVAILVILIGCTFLYVMVERMRDEEFATIVAGFAVNGALLLYTSCEIWFAGTPGKLLTGLRIRRQDGSVADRWQRFLRWQTKYFGAICALLFAASGLLVFKALGGFANFVIFVGSFFAANDDKLAWHDQWSGTAVYWKRTVTPPLTAPPPPLPVGVA
jgi:uncharacterized RDD family membrane protein YckC